MWSQNGFGQGWGPNGTGPFGPGGVTPGPLGPFGPGAAGAMSAGPGATIVCAYLAPSGDLGIPIIPGAIAIPKNRAASRTPKRADRLAANMMASLDRTVCSTDC